MNKIVGFELAKLLKEKGFDNESSDFYDEKGIVRYDHEWPSLYRTKIGFYYDAPTIAEVVMWLYEKHNYWITVDVDAIDNWIYEITNTSHTRNSYVKTPSVDSKSPERAYVAAIYHCLTKLINKS